MVHQRAVARGIQGGDMLLRVHEVLAAQRAAPCITRLLQGHHGGHGPFTGGLGQFRRYTDHDGKSLGDAPPRSGRSFAAPWFPL